MTRWNYVRYDDHYFSRRGDLQTERVMVIPRLRNHSISDSKVLTVSPL